MFLEPPRAAPMGAPMKHRRVIRVASAAAPPPLTQNGREADLSESLG